MNNDNVKSLLNVYPTVEADINSDSDLHFVVHMVVRYLYDLDTLQKDNLT